MDFLQRKYLAAANEFQKTLAIDPEDLFAHYNLMLCYMGLGNPAGAAREEKLYLRFKANEIARSVTGPFRLTHPDDNNESLPVHEHVSVPVNELNRPPAYWYNPYVPQDELATDSASHRLNARPARKLHNVNSKTEITTKTQRHQERQVNGALRPDISDEISVN
jgi:hypothetical protein